ncbi:SMI1/KNR4 family protein [Streptomyces sp. NPDC059168]|uniref:SMI1/KNR4 family protein n=1 Tax=Streptomyces sp. NPDC059168 TaxID=3346753 RepID=UPI00368CBB80
MNQSAREEAFRLEDLWPRFEGWLARNTPEDEAALRPGASAAELAGLEAEIGFPLDDDLRALLARHNGVVPRRSSTQAGAFLLGHGLLGTDGIAEWRRNLADMASEAVEEGYEDEVVGRTAHERWVPFAQSLTGDLLFVDHRDDHHGEIGEISFGDPEYRWLWPGLKLMLHDLCESLEGMTPLPTAGRRPCVHEGRMLEWVAA